MAEFNKPGPKARASSPVSKVLPELKPPIYLTSEGEAIWLALYPHVRQYITEANVRLFCAYCEQCVIAERCTDELADGVLVIQDSMGKELPRPEIRILESAMRLMLQTAKALGFDKSIKIGVIPEEEDDELAQIRKERAELDAMM